jgi:hypothetical protein
MKATARARVEKEELDILDIVGLDRDIESFLTATNGVLSILQSELLAEEETIDQLTPTKDYQWPKNTGCVSASKKPRRHWQTHQATKSMT